MKKTTILKSISMFCLVFLFSISSFGQNTALDFDGTAGAGGSELSGQLVKTATMIPLLDTFTVMGWVNVKAADSNIFVWGCFSLDNYAAIKVTLDFKLRFLIPGDSNFVDSNTTLDTGWHHIAIKNNHGTITVYINGVAENFGNIDMASIVPSISTFGTGIFNGNWEGAGNLLIDEFSVWQTALSDAEIQFYLNTNPTGSELNLLAGYNFNMSKTVINPGGDNSENTELQDLTGNYPGTLHGFPLTGKTGNWVKKESKLVLSTNLFDKNKDVKIYPNPTSDYIQVSNMLSNKNYKIYTVLGTEVLSNTIKTNDKIDVRALREGIYFIAIENSRTLKFVKK